eukprot:4045958-Ditylum_brightwellii.AAC.1
MALEHYINNVNVKEELVQETNKTDEEDFILPKIFEEHLTEAEKMKGYDYSWRHHNSGNKTIGLYAAKLKKNNMNPMRLTSKQHTIKN